MAPPGSNFAGRPHSRKARFGFTRGLKRFFMNFTNARSRSRPNTLSLFDIVTHNSAAATLRKHASRVSIRYEDSALGSSTSARANIPNSKPALHSHNARKVPRMADRVVGVRLESAYDDGETSGGYVFASALQDAWHAQDIENLSTRI